MSSKKIYKTLGFEEDVAMRIEEEARHNRRSRSFIVEEILRQHWEMPWGELEEKVHADKA